MQNKLLKKMYIPPPPTHVSPVNPKPGGQIHKKPFCALVIDTQVPPFWQGWGKHAAVKFSKMERVKKSLWLHKISVALKMSDSQRRFREYSMPWHMWALQHLIRTSDCTTHPLDPLVEIEWIYLQKWIICIVPNE